MEKQKNKNNPKGNPSENARIERIVRLIELLMDKDTDPETKIRIRDWFTKAGATTPMDEGLAGYLESIEPDNLPLTGDTLRRYNAIAEKLGLPLATENKSVRKIVRKRLLWRVAAMIPFIALLGGAYFSGLFSSDAPSIVDPVRVAVAEGTQKHITLPDGTDVWLNEGTTLDYGREFTGNRLLEISGEAFFDVAKLEGKPFVVRTGSLEVTVTGTQFDVRDYGTESNAQIALLSGSVEVGAGRRRVSLKPSDRLRMDKSGGRFEITTIEDIHALGDWRSAASFEGASLETVLDYLSGHYNISNIHRGRSARRPGIYRV